MPELSRQVKAALDAAGLRDALDEGALGKLAKADPDRAVEIIEDMSAKGDVRNPSAFIASAISKFPHRRGRPGEELDHKRGRPAELEELLSKHPRIEEQFDERAKDRLRSADPARAVEIVKELLAKDDVRNPSAFVSSALDKYPQKRGNRDEERPSREERPPRQPVQTRQHSRGPEISRHQRHAGPTALEQVLAMYPDIHASLVADGRILHRLQDADPDRVMEIFDDMANRGDVRNPAAFISKALSSFPQRRGAVDGGAMDIEQLLSRYPEIAGGLDDGALAKLGACEPARAIEIIQDLAAKSDVRNPSAFVASALNKYPNVRGGASPAGGAMEYGPPAWAYGYDGGYAGYPSPPPGLGSQRTTHGGYGQGGPQHPLDRVLSQNAWIALDEKALERLYQADVDRAIEIIQDIDGNVRNPSAFVCQALNSHPEKRGSREENGGMMGLQQALARCPAIARALDAKAMQKLESVDPQRALEILEDVSSKRDIQNVSAFVSKALSSFPQKRGYEESFGSAPSRQQPLEAVKRERDGASRRRSSADPAASLDESAQRSLDKADPERAAEIMQELADKGSEIRNASAFVARALQQYPQVRGRRQ